jgi:hypothetical protein
MDILGENRRGDNMLKSMIFAKERKG